ncbi:hypothetical protein D3C76_1481900 [compost metagenome]
MEHPQLEHGGHIAVVGRQLHPVKRRAQVPRHPHPAQVELRQPVLAEGIPRLRRLAIEADGLRQILLAPLPHLVAPAHQRQRPGLTLIGQRLPDPGRLLEVAYAPGTVGRRQILLGGERDQTPDDQADHSDKQPARRCGFHDDFRDPVLILSM